MFVAYGYWGAFLGGLVVTSTYVLIGCALISLRRQTLARRAARRHLPLSAYAGLITTMPCLILLAVRTVQAPERMLIVDGLIFLVPLLALFLLSVFILYRHWSTSLTRRS